jgi:hypothetical protein
MLLPSLHRLENLPHSRLEPETDAVARYLCDGELVHSSRLSSEGIWARVWNISADGIDLPQSAPLAPDTELVIRMKPAEPDTPLALVGRVAQATRQANGNWLVRCDSLRRATAADLFTRSELSRPVRSPHSFSQARRVLLACYGLCSPKRVVFSN